MKGIKVLSAKYEVNRLDIFINPDYTSHALIKLLTRYFNRVLKYTT